MILIALNLGLIGALIGMVLYFTKERKKKRALLAQIDDFEFLNLATRDCVWKLDLKTMKTVANSFLLQTLGYSREEVANNPSWWVSNIHPEDKSRMLLIYEQTLLDPVTTHEDEYRFRCADGSYKLFLDRAYIKRDTNGKPIYMIGAMQDITETRALQAEIHNQRLQLEQLKTRAVIEAQEEEREKVGYELHENINQLLAGAKLYLGQARDNAPRDDESLQEACILISMAITEIKNLTNGISPPWFDQISLVNAISNHCTAMEEQKGITLQIEHEDFNESRLNNEQKLALYRIIQEQFSNVLKHSGCKTMIVELSTGSSITMNIIDDGIGFDPNAFEKGLGLLRITKRAELYNGKVELHSSPEKGCRLTVEIPL